MEELEAMVERIHQAFERRTAVRDGALSRARMLTRHCAQAIRAVHRDEKSVAQMKLEEARHLVDALRDDLAAYPDLYHAGYTQDALKEFAEASIVYTLVYEGSLPAAEDLGVEYAAYLKGLAESVGEFRRRCLDILRDGYSEQVERLLGYMDEIYDVLVTMDYPDAITGGLRRLTDIARSLTERTRGDITISLRGEHLEKSLRDLEARLNDQ